jgi:hypothetical protein
MNDDKFLKDIFKRVYLPEVDINKNVMNSINSKKRKNAHTRELAISISLSLFLIISTGMVGVKFFKSMNLLSTGVEYITSSNSTDNAGHTAYISQLIAAMNDTNKNQERNDW